MSKTQLVQLALSELPSKMGEQGVAVKSKPRDSMRANKDLTQTQKTRID